MAGDKIRTDDEGHPDLTQFSEHGFVDMVFLIVDTRVDANEWTTVKVRAHHEGVVVGFSLAIRPGMKPGVVDEEIDKSAFYPGAVVLIRDGSASDAFLRAVERLYGTAPRKAPFRERVEVTSICLEGDPRQLKRERVKFKLFHDDQDEREEYFELYLHVNLPAGLVQLNGKDQEYRPTVLRSLAALA